MENKSFKIFTIGFTGTTAENFFSRLSQAGVRKVIDTRLWADTQLSGFARKTDLPFLLKNLSGANYEHKIDLAPSENILKDFKTKKSPGWNMKAAISSFCMTGILQIN